MQSIASSCLPTCIPEDIRDEMITNAKRLIEIKNVRKAFNNIDFEVPRDHTSRALTLTVSKKGVVLCKKSECLHFNMFGVCCQRIAVAEFTNNLNDSLSNYVEKSKRGKLIEMIRCGHPSGSGTKKGFKKKRISRSGYKDQRSFITTRGG